MLHYFFPLYFPTIAPITIPIPAPIPEGTPVNPCKKSSEEPIATPKIRPIPAYL